MDNIDRFVKQGGKKKVVVVQGLGFVGAAMLTAIATAGRKGSPLYSVIGVDLPAPSVRWKIESINRGKLPLKSSDKEMAKAFRSSFLSGNIMATAQKYAYEKADIIVISINLDIKKDKAGDIRKSDLSLGKFISAIRDIAMRANPGALVILESTVPPGTCEKILLPLFKKEFRRRGFGDERVNFVYSYERVMPGRDYLKSIISYYRVFAAADRSSAVMARRFFESIIDTKNYPLTELKSTTAAEMGKVLENSYRAVNIAFIQEWTELAASAGVDLYEVISGIRKRRTHNNIMLPGFGVGGYCLPKDPVLAEWGRRYLLGGGRRMEMSTRAVSINDNMPLYSLSLLKAALKKLKNRKILLMGVSYSRDVMDTRFSPAEAFYKKCVAEGAKVSLHDSLVSYWPEAGRQVANNLTSLMKGRSDAVVLALKHPEYVKITPEEYARILRPGGAVIDCGDIIDDRKAALLRAMGFKVLGVGKGHWQRGKHV